MAAYLRNRIATSANKEHRTSFETWYGYRPDISHLRIFGCTAYCHVLIRKGGNSIKSLDECALLAIARIQKGIG